MAADVSSSSSPKVLNVAEHSPQRSASARLDDDPPVAPFLSALDDETCREIIETAADGWYSVDDLVAACDASQSTVYRKVDRLTDLGVLDQSVQIRSSGTHTTVYSCSISDVRLSLDGDNGLTIECVQSSPGPYHKSVTGVYGD